MRSFTLFLTGFLCCYVLSVAAQSPLSLQYKISSDNGQIESHLTTQDGNQLFLCYSHDTISSSGYHITVIKTDSSGTILWSQRFGDSRFLLSNIVESPDSTYFFIATDNNTFFGQSQKSYHEFRLDQNGNILFNRQLQLPPNFGTGFIAPKVIARNNGYYGCMHVSDSLNQKAYWNVFCLDTSGNPLWSNCYDTIGVDYNSTWLTMDTCNNGDIFLAGTVEEPPSMNRTISIVRITPTGNQIWIKHFQSNNYDLMPVSLTHIPGDDFYLTSTTFIPFTTYPEVSVIRISGQGVIVFSKRYSIPLRNMEPQDAMSTGDKKLSWCAHGQDSIQPSSYFVVLDSFGTVMVADKYPWMLANSIDTLNDSTYSVAGANELNYNNHPYWETLDQYGQSCNSFPITITENLLPLSLIFSSGTRSLPLTIAPDSLPQVPATIQSTQLCATGIIESETESFLVYPVPATEEIHVVTNVQFNAIRIFNSNGELVLDYNSSCTNCELNVADLPNGIYLLQLISANDISTKKIIINR